ncbi:MAG TPA: carboxypeptidase-like regulatory domain-containing protein [Candidatus Paceibacterota bacterium]|nr:carboxypeptidase-like regulatory domain-containing protein [Candidatus Paceibacterota bacterium]
MSLSVRSHALKLVLVTASVIILALGSFVILGVPQAAAADDPKLVWGWVKDSADRVLVGADIVVNIWDPTNTTNRASRSDTTDGAGFYSVNFLAADWQIGDWIEVLCDYNGAQDDNGTVAGDTAAPFIQYINITYPYEIPEFGSALGLIVSGAAVGAVAVVMMVYFRRK